MKNESKELVPQGSTELTNPVMDSKFELFNEPEQALNVREIFIPKIIAMQGQSPLVLEGVAKFGELRDTLNNEVLACAEFGKNPSVPLEFIPFKWQKYWIVKVEDGDKWKFESMELINKDTENFNPFETWMENDGKSRKRVFLHLFYVLIPGKSIPYTLGFKGSSKRHGDALMTNMFVINKMIKTDLIWKKSAMAKVMQLTPKKETKEKNTYIVLETRPLRDSTYEEACEALAWLQTFSTNSVVVDNTDIMQETGATILNNSDY